MRLRYSALIVVLCGGTLFYGGYRLGALDDNAKSRDEQFIAFFLAAVIPSSIAFTSWSVNSEINALSNGRIEEAKRKRIQAIGRCKAMYQENIGLIKEKLRPLKASEEVYERCLIEIENCQLLIQEFEDKERASSEIYDWLFFKQNRRKLRENLVSSTEENYIIPSHLKGQFNKDIGRCINWLKDSILELSGFEVDKQKLAASSLDMPDGLRPQIEALNAIKKHEVLLGLSGDSNVLNDFVDELIAKLQSG